MHDVSSYPLEMEAELARLCGHRGASLDGEWANQFRRMLMKPEYLELYRLTRINAAKVLAERMMADTPPSLPAA